MTRKTASIAMFVAAAVLVAVCGCSSNEPENVITPNAARLEINDVATDPAVFLRKNPTDTSNADDVVVVDVMLRSTAAIDFSTINIELLFDPGVVQIGQLNMTATPLGDCTSAASCAPLCLENASTSGADAANKTGDLVVGVSARALCPAASATGEVTLMTLAFIGASTGSSTLTLVDGAGHGDCEILDANQAALPIPCDSGGATVIVTR